MFNETRFREGSEVPGTMLFDLESDPYELINLVRDPAHADALAELDDMLWRYLEETDSPILHGAIDHPITRDLWEEYHSQKGEWQRTADPGTLIEKKAEEGSRYTIATDSHKLMIHFRGIHRLNSVQLFDLSSDREEKENVADAEEYAETFAEMKALLWSWLESESDPILEGRAPSEALQTSLAEYTCWKDAGRPRGRNVFSIFP